MLLHTIEDRRYLRFERLAAQRGLRHAFSTRPQDVSARADAAAAERAARRAQMARDLGLDPGGLQHCVQIHQPNLSVIRGPSLARPLPDCDGSLCAAPGTVLMCFSADCPLLIAYDPRTPALGVAHASWRCTVAWMARRLIERMTIEFGSRPADVLAGVGPSAGPERYEVQDDVRAAAQAAGLSDLDRLFPRRDGRMFFDLWEANRLQLLAAGVGEARIAVAGLCTIERNDLFYSYRREGAGCGHFGLMAGLVAG